MSGDSGWRHGAGLRGKPGNGAEQALRRGISDTIGEFRHRVNAQRSRTGGAALCAAAPLRVAGAMGRVLTGATAAKRRLNS
jgi:hypothetical protein